MTIEEPETGSEQGPGSREDQNDQDCISPARLAPFRVAPQFSPRIWGRTDLRPWYAETPAEPIGEAWLTGPGSLVVTGRHKGRTLSQALPDFPLLVKLLFPAEKLSVQVHPDDERARAVGLDRGKTECWYVLEAEPGAAVACGLRKGVAIADLESAISGGTVENLLDWIPVSAGDAVFVEAGTVHAICPGVTLLEVQQCSDVTYRLYDYGRPRELHLEEGLDAVKTETGAGKVQPRQMDGFVRLVETAFFVVDRFDLAPGEAREMPMDGLGCVACLSGAGAVHEVPFSAGQAVIVPPGSVTLTSRQGAVLLRCWKP